MPRIGTTSSHGLGTRLFSATGGTITTSGAYTIHTFTSSGSFVVTGSKSVEYLIVGGGGAGGCGGDFSGYGDNNGGCGGGGGGVLMGTTTVTQQTYSITVGSGGLTTGLITNTSASGDGGNGGNSSALGLTAVGGGGGAGASSADVLQQSRNGRAGGSGGGSLVSNYHLRWYPPRRVDTGAPGSGQTDMPNNTASHSASGGAGTAGQGNAGANTSGTSIEVTLPDVYIYPNLAPSWYVKSRTNYWLMGGGGGAGAAASNLSVTNSWSPGMQTGRTDSAGNNQYTIAGQARGFYYAQNAPFTNSPYPNAWRNEWPGSFQAGNGGAGVNSSISGTLKHYGAGGGATVPSVVPYGLNEWDRLLGPAALGPAGTGSIGPGAEGGTGAGGGRYGHLNTAPGSQADYPYNTLTGQPTSTAVANTGGGGGGAGNGASGIVIIRYLT